VCDQYVAGGSAGFGAQCRTISLRESLLWNGKHRAVELWKNDTAGVLDGDFDAERFVEPQDRAGLTRARRIVLARDHDDRGRRQAGPQPLELPKTVQNRGIRRPDRVEQITGDDDQLGFLLQEIVDRAFEDFGDIDLTLVRTLRRLPVELAEPQMQVGKVGERHCKRIVV